MTPSVWAPTPSMEVPQLLCSSCVQLHHVTKAQSVVWAVNISTSNFKSYRSQNFEHKSSVTKTCTKIRFIIPWSGYHFPNEGIPQTIDPAGLIDNSANANLGLYTNLRSCTEKNRVQTRFRNHRSGASSVLVTQPMHGRTCPLSRTRCSKSHKATAVIEWDSIFQRESHD